MISRREVQKQKTIALGKKVLEIEKKEGLSLNEIAKRLGFTYQWVWESSRRAQYEYEKNDATLAGNI